MEIRTNLAQLSQLPSSRPQVEGSEPAKTEKVDSFQQTLGAAAPLVLPYADKLTQQLMLHWFQNRPVQVEVAAGNNNMTYIMPSVNTGCRVGEGPWPTEHYTVPGNVDGKPFELKFDFDPATFSSKVSGETGAGAIDLSLTTYADMFPQNVGSAAGSQIDFLTTGDVSRGCTLRGRISGQRYTLECTNEFERQTRSKPERDGQGLVGTGMLGDTPVNVQAKIEGAYVVLTEKFGDVTVTKRITDEFPGAEAYNFSK